MAPRHRLLIVDDSPVTLSFLQAVFTSASFDGETANDGDEGLDKALSGAPDLIVTDSLMPNVDGWELLRRLKSHAATAAIPVIMLTAGDVADADNTARVPQPDALVTKSMDVGRLLEHVKALLIAKS